MFAFGSSCLNKASHHYLAFLIVVSPHSRLPFPKPIPAFFSSQAYTGFCPRTSPSHPQLHPRGYLSLQEELVAQSSSSSPSPKLHAAFPWSFLRQRITSLPILIPISTIPCRLCPCAQTVGTYTQGNHLSRDVIMLIIKTLLGGRSQMKTLKMVTLPDSETFDIPCLVAFPPKF